MRTPKVHETKDSKVSRPSPSQRALVVQSLLVCPDRQGGDRV
jgi:hypothetical protein